ncbi:FadR/GntR family transcriptional regulator [Neisseria weaveri]|uniref:FadR/GntR family transcriptional regulator n=1 Tax=Neisseria weaveri TaxID=28091 RepID=UPI0002232BF7|nr:FadR/GntR family transcriptional regulator [Neisseria weaveri]EGV36328.1 transcriptional regulator, GntR family [Neisseria weaveri ATCC 51223]
MSLLKSKTLSEQICGIIEKRIISGEYPVSTKLPPERKLAEEFDVSRPSIRAALKMLVARNMLAARQGDGYYVSLQYQEDFLHSWKNLLGSHPDWESDVFDFNRSIEGCMAALAAKRRTDTDLERIEFWVNKFEEAYVKQNREQQEEADVCFHQAIAEASHNILFSHLSNSLLNMLYYQTRSRIMYTEGIEDPRPALISQHRAIFEAIKAEDSKQASFHAEQHLNYVADCIRQNQEYRSRSEYAGTLAQNDRQKTDKW